MGSSGGRAMKNIHRAWAVCLGCTLALLVCGGL
mgnify:CR=1 FL=1